MQREGFYEESVSSVRAHREEKMYTVFKTLAILFFVLGGILLSFVFVFVPSVLEQTVNEAGEVNTVARIVGFVEYFTLVAVFLGSGFGCWFFKNRYNISYDYTFVEDELRITKVFNGKKRKFITTLHADRILQIGWVESDAFQRALAGFHGKKPKYMTPNREAQEGREMIYLVHSTSIERQLYVIECRRALLEQMVLACGRNKLERKE